VDRDGIDGVRTPARAATSTCKVKYCDVLEMPFARRHVLSPADVPAWIALLLAYDG
jgi:hypothetical protein